ncbi:porphobilinogen deaminase, dipyromethane cofactor binding domain-containing protein [Melampsora americana]|nr:porphobilinogen deaminase, dipyromethane cofactor binding domain-containing protein [Melampsora americana]
MEFPTLESYLSLPSDSTSQQTQLIPLLDEDCHESVQAPPSISPPIVIGTRNSRLALVQAELVRRLFEVSHPKHPTSIQSMSTAGDQNQGRPLYLMGGKSLWTKELEVALLEGSVDLIVHSLKDMPTSLPPGCELGAILEREDPRDALVIRRDLPFRSLNELPAGSVIGTSSVRRVAQLRRRFPQLKFQDIRGNLNTRFRKLDAPDSPYTGIILAVAGLNRLECADRISSYLSPPELYYAVGQGAIGIEIRGRAEDVEVTPIAAQRTETVRQLVKSLEHLPTALVCHAERSLLRTLEGGCSVPVGVTSTLVPLPMPCQWAPQARLTLTGVVTSVDGTKEVTVTKTADIYGAKDSIKLGCDLAVELLEAGADEILDELNVVKEAAGDGTEEAEISRIGAVEAKTHIQIAAPADSERTMIGANETHSAIFIKA